MSFLFILIILIFIYELLIFLNFSGAYGQYVCWVKTCCPNKLQDPIDTKCKSQSRLPFLYIANKYLK